MGSGRNFHSLRLSAPGSKYFECKNIWKTSFAWAKIASINIKFKKFTEIQEKCNYLKIVASKCAVAKELKLFCRHPHQRAL